MNLLLDTHIVFWMYADLARLTEAEVRALQDPANRLFVSIASLWEMGIKAALGRFTIPPNLVEELAEDDIRILPISVEHALALAALPPIHKDPFDRMLVVQAMHEGLTLVTRDPWVASYPVATFPG